MDAAPGNSAQLAAAAKHIVQRVLTMSENPRELFMMEVQEEREWILRVILLASFRSPSR